MFECRTFAAARASRKKRNRADSSPTYRSRMTFSVTSHFNKDAPVSNTQLLTISPVRTLQGHSDDVTAVALTSDGRRVVSGSRDKTLCVWDLESGQLIRTLHGHTREIGTVALTVDGRWIVSGSWDNTLRLWDLESGESIRTLKGHRGEATAVR
jgi:WD40 repeat protein